MNPERVEPHDLIRAALTVLVEPGDVHELRIPKAGRARTISGYFDDLDAMARAAAEYDGKVPGVYLTLNPCAPSLLARSTNRAAGYAETTSNDKDIERRRAIATIYQAGLGDLPELALPAAPGSDPRHFDVYQNYELEADRRDDLRAHLETHGVRTIVQWAGTPVHKFKDLAFTVDLPKTDIIFTRCLLLPMNTALTDEDVGYIIASIRSFYARS